METTEKPKFKKGDWAMWNDTKVMVDHVITIPNFYATICIVSNGGTWAAQIYESSLTPLKKARR